MENREHLAKAAAQMEEKKMLKRKNPGLEDNQIKNMQKDMQGIEGWEPTGNVSKKYPGKDKDYDGLLNKGGEEQEEKRLAA